ncbi:ABC transporter permease [Ruminococcaceae bacterium OttesenSCG-928-L11]|nr:ABC transporter permease [Ruminococcaceae bacterium OttesenSCG-928-L11]
MTLMVGSLQLGLIYGLLALGIYITFRILGIPDLTADGSFTLGMSVSAAMTVLQTADGTVLSLPGLGIFLAFLAGMAAGAVTGCLQTKLGIHPILSGILTMSGLYTVNLLILGSRSNVSLINGVGLFDSLNLMLGGDVDKNLIRTVIPVLFCVAAFLILSWFFRTHLGLCIRATGNNEDMVTASSINVDAMKITAIAIANGCVALSGAVLAQYQGYADLSSGTGTVVVGLASVIIGEVFFGKRSVVIGFASAITGAVIYRFLIALALKIDGFPAYALKLVSAVIVIIALSIPTVQAKLRFARQKREAKQHA